MIEMAIMIIEIPRPFPCLSLQQLFTLRRRSAGGAPIAPTTPANRTDENLSRKYGEEVSSAHKTMLPHRKSVVYTLKVRVWKEECEKNGDRGKITGGDKGNRRGCRMRLWVIVVVGFVKGGRVGGWPAPSSYSAWVSLGVGVFPSATRACLLGCVGQGPWNRNTEGKNKETHRYVEGLFAIASSGHAWHEVHTGAYNWYKVKARST